MSQCKFSHKCYILLHLKTWLLLSKQVLILSSFFEVKVKPIHHLHFTFITRMSIIISHSRIIIFITSLRLRIIFVFIITTYINCARRRRCYVKLCFFIFTNFGSFYWNWIINVYFEITLVTHDNFSEINMLGHFFCKETGT